jgi:magnesium transporter
MIEFIRKSIKSPVERTGAATDGAWINVEAPTAAELDELANKFGLDRGNLADVLDVDEVPRFERHDDHSYIFLRYAHQKSGAATTLPLLIIIGDKGLMTITPTHPDCFDKLLTDDSPIATAHPTELLLHILDRIFDDYDFYIKGISHRIQKSVARMRNHKLESDDFVSFVLIEEQLSDFLGALTPMTAILRRIMVGRHTALTAAESDMVDDILLGIEQSINSCNSNARRIVSIREAYSTLSNNSLNRSMKALTAATLIIALPNVVFGMYGMNIELPLQHYDWAYVAIASGTIAIIILIIIVAKKRRIF